MIEINQVLYEIDKKKILDISLQIQKDCLILGPSGSGKSTLLHIISGMLRPSAGEVIIQGKHIQQMKESERDLFRANHIGVIPQRFHLVPALNVIQNLRLPGLFSNHSFNDHFIEEGLERLGLADKKNAKPHELSVGEVQRVSILRSFVNQPDYILADEPTSALDDENCEKVIELLLHQSKAMKANLIIATHDQRLKNHFQEKVEIA